MNSNPPVAPPPEFSGKAYERLAHWLQSQLRHVPRLSKRRRIVAYARASLRYHGRMRYTEGLGRGQLFHRPRGRFDGASADCSQYSAALCHWAGVKDVTDTDWTGTLGKKGRWLDRPVPGCFVFFGMPPYVHMGVMVNRSDVIGFGDPAAPDKSSLAGLLAYFAGRGHAGHSFRDLTL